MQFKPTNDKYITIQVGDEEFKLKTAIIGGVLLEDEGFPMGMYSGSQDIGDIGVAVLHSCRAIMKILKEMHGLNMEQSIDFIRFCTLEASDREEMSENMEHLVDLGRKDIIRKMMDL
jgi:hypothetical protein